MSEQLQQITDFLRGILMRVGDGHFGLIAAGVAFYAMFAVFPGLAACVALFSLLADPAVISEYLEVAQQFLPYDAGVLVHDQVMGLLATPRATLGWATFLTVAVALYSARAGVAAIIQGLDVVHRATPRGWIWGWVMDIALTLALVAAVIVGLATVLIVPVVLDFVSFGPVERWVLAILPWVATFLLLVTCLSILYLFGPNIPSEERRPPVLIGVMVAALTWSLVSFAFSSYIANFDSYNRIYGSIGAVAALLMWLYLSALAVLLGGAVNAELGAPHRQRAV